MPEAAAVFIYRQMCIRDRYIGLDTRVSNLPSWLSGWTANDYILQASNDVTYKIYQKNFNQGDKVTLGTNGPPSGVVMYTAFVKQAVTPTPEPAPVCLLYTSRCV